MRDVEDAGACGGGFGAGDDWRADTSVRPYGGLVSAGVKRRRAEVVAPYGKAF